MTFEQLIHLCSENLQWAGTRPRRIGISPRSTCPYIGWMPCRGNPPIDRDASTCGCPIVGRFSTIDSAVSRYESRPTQAQETDNYPADLEHKERRSPFPTNDSALCSGRGLRSEQLSDSRNGGSLFTITTAKCQHTLAKVSGFNCLYVVPPGLLTDSLPAHKLGIILSAFAIRAVHVIVSTSAATNASNRQSLNISSATTVIIIAPVCFAARCQLS